MNIGRRAGRLFRLAFAALLISAQPACETSQPLLSPTACSGDEFYFPRDTFPRDYPASDETRRRWYSTTLARLGEPSLSCGEQSGESYRFVWLHSLAQPVVIRILRREQQIEASAFQLSGTGMGDPGFLSYHIRKQLSVEDWERLQTALHRSQFWSMPTSGNMYGAHGEQWIVEGRHYNIYQIVDRWSPPAGAYRDLGVFFFDAVGWQRPNSSTY